MAMDPQQMQEAMQLHRFRQQQEAMQQIQQEHQPPTGFAAPMNPIMGPQDGPPDMNATTHLINNLLQAATQRVDLDFDVQTKGILTLAQAIQQLYASGHVEAIAQQHEMMLNGQDQQFQHGQQAQQQQFQQGQATQQQQHQQGLDQARLAMEQQKHQQDLQHTQQKHQADLLALGHDVASQHHQQNLDNALQIQGQQHQQQMAEQQQKADQALSKQQAAQKPAPGGASGKK